MNRTTRGPRASLCAAASFVLGASVLGLARTVGALQGADIYIGELAQLQQFGRVGSIVGLMGDAPVCNAGTADLDWLVSPSPLHPFMNFNLYRLKGPRLQQIGQSWTKHGQGAAQNNACGFGCNPYPNSDRLGVGCSDTYSAQFNANSQNYMGPRSEVNPWTGSWSFNGSHMSQGNHPHGPIDHRLQVNDNDLDPAQNAGAQYFYELCVFGWDDGNHMNSIAREPVGVSGSPGGTWTFSLGGSNTSLGPAIESWPGATVTTIQNLTTDGRAMVAVKVTTNPNASTHFEFAIYNHDMDRGIGSFSVPRAATAVIGNINFSAVLSHEEQYSNDPWPSSTAGNVVSWSTQPFSSNPFANPIRWGTMYNFWFDSSAAASSTTVTLGAFKPGTPAQYTGSSQGPVGPVRKPGDVNNSGIVNVDDLLAVINGWGPCPPPAPGNCTADIAPAPAGNGTVNVDDLLLVINNWT